MAISMMSDMRAVGAFSPIVDEKSVVPASRKRRFWVEVSQIAFVVSTGVDSAVGAALVSREKMCHPSVDCNSNRLPSGDQDADRAGVASCGLLVVPLSMLRTERKGCVVRRAATDSSSGEIWKARTSSERAMGGASRNKRMPFTIVAAPARTVKPCSQGRYPDFSRRTVYDPGARFPMRKEFPEALTRRPLMRIASGAVEELNERKPVL